MQINVKRQGLSADPEERRMLREEEKATVGQGEWPKAKILVLKTKSMLQRRTR